MSDSSELKKIGNQPHWAYNAPS